MVNICHILCLLYRRSHQNTVHGPNWANHAKVLLENSHIHLHTVNGYIYTTGQSWVVVAEKTFTIWHSKANICPMLKYNIHFLSTYHVTHTMENIGDGKMHVFCHQVYYHPQMRGSWKATENCPLEPAPEGCIFSMTK